MRVPLMLSRKNRCVYFVVTWTSWNSSCKVCSPRTSTEGSCLARKLKSKSGKPRAVLGPLKSKRKLFVRIDSRFHRRSLRRWRRNKRALTLKISSQWDRIKVDLWNDPTCSGGGDLCEMGSPLKIGSRNWRSEMFYLVHKIFKSHDAWNLNWSR